MKKQIALAVALYMGLALSVQAQEAGTLKLVKGDVRVVDARGERTVQPGDHIAVADKLITGTDGSASMVMRDGTTVVVGPKSKLELKDFSFDDTTQKGSMLVSLVQGSLRMITGLISKVNPGAISVTTKSATIGVRGTDFIVQADE